MSNISVIILIKMNAKIEIITVMHRRACHIPLYSIFNSEWKQIRIEIYLQTIKKKVNSEI